MARPWRTPLGSLARLVEDEEPGRACGEARGGGGLGPRPMAPLVRKHQTDRTRAARVRRRVSARGDAQPPQVGRTFPERFATALLPNSVAHGGRGWHRNDLSSRFLQTNQYQRGQGGTA